MVLFDVQAEGSTWSACVNAGLINGGGAERQSGALSSALNGRFTDGF